MTAETQQKQEPEARTGSGFLNGTTSPAKIRIFEARSGPSIMLTIADTCPRHHSTNKTFKEFTKYSKSLQSHHITSQHNAMKVITESAL